MTKAKAVNYTVEQENRLTQAYTACGTGVEQSDFEARTACVESLAIELGKSVRSIRSKLTNMKKYIKAGANISNVTGEVAMKKDAMAQVLRDVSGLNLNVESMQKMNKTDIQLLITHFEEIFKDDCEAENDVETETTE